MVLVSRSEDTSQELGLSFHHAGPRNCLSSDRQLWQQTPLSSCCSLATYFTKKKQLWAQCLPEILLFPH